MKPYRVQRKRNRGWLMPPNTVCVCRPGIFGNPYRVGVNFLPNWNGWCDRIPIPTRECAIDHFRTYATSRLKIDKKYRAAMESIRGKNLACWCPLDQPCHADVLLEIAND